MPQVKMVKPMASRMNVMVFSLVGLIFCTNYCIYAKHPSTHKMHKRKLFACRNDLRR